MKKRKHYPGEERKPGTKDYAVILTKLFGAKNDFSNIEDKTDKNLVKVTKKIAEKLKELGFKRESNSVIARSKNSEMSFKNKDKIIEIVTVKWREGKEKHLEARDAQSPNGQ